MVLVQQRDAPDKGAGRAGGGTPASKTEGVAGVRGPGRWLDPSEAKSVICLMRKMKRRLSLAKRRSGPHMLDRMTHRHPGVDGVSNTVRLVGSPGHRPRRALQLPRVPAS